MTPAKLRKDVRSGFIFNLLPLRWFRLAWLKKISSPPHAINQCSGFYPNEETFFCCQCYPQFFVIVIGNDYLQGRLCFINPSDSFQRAEKHDLWVAIHLLSFSSLTKSHILAQTDREVMESPSLQLLKNCRDAALRDVAMVGWVGDGLGDFFQP